MASTITEWLEEHASQLVTQQRAEADNSKLLATFVGAVGATLVATALQVSTGGGAASVLDVVSVAFLALAIASVYAVVRRDRIRPGNQVSVFMTHAAETDQAVVLKALRDESIKSAEENWEVLEEIREAVRWVLLSSALAGGFAVASLLLPIFAN